MTKTKSNTINTLKTVQIIEDSRATLLLHEYIPQRNLKRQIVLHHTVGGGNPFNVATWWKSTPARVGTAFVISGWEDNTKSYSNGQIYQLFPEESYAWHVNARIAGAEQIEKHSIGIEICNYGQLTLIDGKYYAVISPTSKREIPVSQVCDLGYSWQGSRYYHAYTDAQIESLRKLLLALCSKHKISMIYNNLFDMSELATKGSNGIWGHCNFRRDKSDVSPQPKLIEMLKGLQNATLATE